MPRPPKPTIPTASPGCSAARRSACSTVAVEHIMIAACSNETWSGMGMAFAAGTTTRSA